MEIFVLDFADIGQLLLIFARKGCERVLSLDELDILDRVLVLQLEVEGVDLVGGCIGNAKFDFDDV